MYTMLRRSLAVAALGGFAMLGTSAVASAQGIPNTGPGPFRPQAQEHAVFVQTDNTAGNQVVAYDRAPNGTLTLAATYDTGGLGGAQKEPAGLSDHLSSQGSLAYDPVTRDLYAVNAGSNTLSVFSVRGDQLSLRQVISSGGVFPASVAVHGDLVYVLNSLGGGSVHGYYSLFGHLVPIPGSNRSLGLTIPNDTTQFLYTPGQVAFSPDGFQLIVTTKVNGNDIDVFTVRPSGNLSATPVMNSEPGTGPFAETFDQAGHLVVANVANDSLATYGLDADGTVSLIDSVGTGQVATCWVTPAGRFFYTANTGSNSLSGFAHSHSGQLTFLGDTSTDTNPQDASATPDGRFLYVQTGAKGIVDEFRVNGNGSLTEIGSVTVATAVGGEGIVAS
jgi:6-phosphogluconolactonase (cycloisomerase 2 family)